MPVVNSFIQGFGEGFDDFNHDELVQFCVSLSDYGLKQEDIFGSVIDRLAEDSEKSKPEHFLSIMRAMLNVSMSRTKAFKSIESLVQKKFNKDLNEIIQQSVINDNDVLGLFNVILANTAEDVVPFVSFSLKLINCSLIIWSKK